MDGTKDEEKINRQATSRDERIKAALRANLKRRKQKIRASRDSGQINEPGNDSDKT